MKLLGSILFAAAVKAEGMMEMPSHDSMMPEAEDLTALDDLATETTAEPATTHHHMEMMTHPEHEDMMTHGEMEDHHEDHHEDHEEEHHEEEHHEDEEHHEEHEEEHHDIPVAPCNSCGCNAAEMAQWKEAMMAWRYDHNGKSDIKAKFNACKKQSATFLYVLYHRVSMCTLYALHVPCIPCI